MVASSVLSPVVYSCKAIDTFAGAVVRWAVDQLPFVSTFTVSDEVRLAAEPFQAPAARVYALWVCAVV